MVATGTKLPDGALLEPRSLLYAINARIGGYGLDLNAFESLRLAARRGFLGQAIGYRNQQKEIPARLITSLAFHPVRILSFLESPFYYDAKKKYVDYVAAQRLATGKFDFFQGWAGNSVRALRRAKALASLRCSRSPRGIGTRGR